MDSLRRFMPKALLFISRLIGLETRDDNEIFLDNCIEKLRAGTLSEKEQDDHRFILFMSERNRPIICISASNSGSDFSD